MPVMPPPSSHASSCLPNELPRGIFNAAGAAAAATSASNTSSPPLHRSGSLSLNDVANLEREVTAARAEYEGLLHELQKRIGRSLKRAEAKAHTELMRRWERYTTQQEQLKHVRQLMAQMAMPGLPPPSPAGGSVPRPWAPSDAGGGGRDGADASEVGSVPIAGSIFGGSAHGGSERGGGGMAAHPGDRISNAIRSGDWVSSDPKRAAAMGMQTARGSKQAAPPPPRLQTDGRLHRTAGLPPEETGSVISLETLSNAGESDRSGNRQGDDKPGRIQVPTGNKGAAPPRKSALSHAGIRMLQAPPEEGGPDDPRLQQAEDEMQKAMAAAAASVKSRQAQPQQDTSSAVKDAKAAPPEKPKPQQPPAEKDAMEQLATARSHTTTTASKEHRELVALLQRALQAVRSSPPDWSRAELLLNRAESRAAALCDASAELPSGGQSAESAAERVRRAALALRRRRRVGSVLGKVKELRTTDAAVNASAKNRQVGEAEVLALLTSLLGDEAVLVTAAQSAAQQQQQPSTSRPARTATNAAEQPTKAPSPPPPVAVPSSGGGTDRSAGTEEEAASAGYLTDRLEKMKSEAYEGVMERLERLRRGGSEAAVALSSATTVAAQPPPQPPPVPKLDFGGRHGQEVGDANAFNEVPLSPVAKAGDSGHASSAAGANNSSLLEQLQHGMETARQKADSRIAEMEAQAKGTLDSLWKRFGGPEARPQEADYVDHVPAPTMRLTRDRGCRSRFSEADWAQRVRERTVGFKPGERAAEAARMSAAGANAPPDEWTLGPARPVHELDTVERYTGKANNFHFC